MLAARGEAVGPPYGYRFRSYQESNFDPDVMTGPSGSIGWWSDQGEAVRVLSARRHKTRSVRDGDASPEVEP
jgi:hypothetical protein